MRFEPIKTKSHTAKHIFQYGAYIIMLTLFVMSIYILSNSNNERQKTYLDHALRKDIAYYYATTGVYPDTLTTIEQKYGLTYDKDKFYIDYKIIGKNIYPKITILER